MNQRSSAPLLAIATILFVCGAAVAGYFLLRGPEPTAVDESPDQKKSAVREAFVAGPDGGVNDAEQGIHALLDSLGKALAAGDGKRAAELYDYELMLAAADQQGLVPSKFRLRRAKMARHMRKDQATKLAETGKLQAWVSHRIVRLRYLEGREEAVVYARHVDADGVVTKMRWWVIKRKGAWRVYDSEDLSMNLRLSTAAGMGLAAAEEEATWGPSLRTVYEALQLFVAEDFQGAHDKLLGLEGVGFPPPLEGLRLFMLGSCQVALLQPDKALATF
ncbi:MAG: hypothetical protein JRI68_08840, partial [Deltaproteobacteria bacterium]|nr:hypothetical protein [Deltaproteobacteria bacterium]